MFTILALVAALVFKDGKHAGFWMLAGSVIDLYVHRKAVRLAGSYWKGRYKAFISRRT